MSCESVYCISGTNSSYDGSYSTGNTLHNGYVYYIRDTSNIFYFLFNRRYRIKLVSINKLDGPCLLFGKSPCVSDCPDLCTEFFSSGTCPTPTPSTTQFVTLISSILELVFPSFNSNTN